MRYFLLSFVLMLFLFNFQPAHGAPPPRFNVFAGFGQNYAFPGTIRLGGRSWEGGLLAPGVLGGLKRFFLVRHSYVSFGPVVTANAGGRFGVGFAGGLGFDLLIHWGLGFRGEILGFTDHNGQSAARGVLGFSYAF